MSRHGKARFDEGKLERLRAFVERFNETAYADEPEEIRLALSKLVAAMRDWLSKPLVTTAFKYDGLPNGQWERLMDIIFKNSKGGSNGKGG